MVLNIIVTVSSFLDFFVWVGGDGGWGWVGGVCSCCELYVLYVVSKIKFVTHKTNPGFESTGRQNGCNHLTVF